MAEDARDLSLLRQLLPHTEADVEEPSHLYRDLGDRDGVDTYLPDSIRRHFPPVTELQQAQYLVRNYLVQLYFGAGKMFWYELVEEPFGVHHPESGFGLLRYNAQLTVKPAAVAFANMVYNYRYLKPIGRYRAQERKTYGFVYEDTRADNAPVLSIWRQSDERVESISREIYPVAHRCRYIRSSGRNPRYRRCGSSAVVDVGPHRKRL